MNGLVLTWHIGSRLWRCASLLTLNVYLTNIEFIRSGLLPHQFNYMPGIPRQIRKPG